MEFWKKYGIQVLVLALCAVLAIGMVRQSADIRALRGELADSRREIDALADRLEQVETALEEAGAEQPEPSIRFENVVVNAADRTLTLDLRAELPDCTGHSVDVSLGSVGEPYRLSMNGAYLTRQDDGSYTDTVMFPLDLDAGIELRLADETVLFSSETMAPLLPLRLAYGSTSWHYNAQEQMFSLCDWTAELTDPAGKAAQAYGGEFRVYRNGTRIFTGRDLPDSGCVEADGEVLDGVGLPCAPGDHLRLCYACTDEFGLQYEFPLCEWKMQRWDDALFCPLSHQPAVTWPE